MKLWYPSYVTDADKGFIQHAVKWHPEFLRDDFAYIRLCRAIHQAALERSETDPGTSTHSDPGKAS